MRRRQFIFIVGGAAAAWPLEARGQQPSDRIRIGVLVGLAEDDPETKTRFAKFQQELDRLGWSEGRNVRIDYRFAPCRRTSNGRRITLISVAGSQILLHFLLCQQIEIGRRRHVIHRQRH
jgi:hypothetical protein